MVTTRTKWWLAAFLATVAMGGCGAQMPQSAAPLDDGQVEDALVTLDGEQPLRVVTRRIDRAQRDDELAARRAGAASASPSVAPATERALPGAADLWLFTEENFGGQRVCVSGHGVVELADIATRLGPLTVRSYFAGDAQGGLVGRSQRSGWPFCFSGFDAHQSAQTLDSCAASAWQVVLDD
jgi:hypothetical protein